MEHLDLGVLFDKQSAHTPGPWHLHHQPRDMRASDDRHGGKPERGTLVIQIEKIGWSITILCVGILGLIGVVGTLALAAKFISEVVLPLVIQIDPDTVLLVLLFLIALLSGAIIGICAVGNIKIGITRD